MTTTTDETTHLRALLAEQTARAERAEVDYRRVLSERAAANQLAGRCAQQRDHALAACAEMRAALENLVATIQRDGLQPDPPDPNAAVRVNHKIRRDWACRGCRPDSDVLKDGFLCAYHRVQALLSRPDLGAGMVVVEREVLERIGKYAREDRMVTPGSTRLARLLADLDALLKKGGG